MRRLIILAAALLSSSSALAQSNPYDAAVINNFRGGIIGGFTPSARWAPPFIPPLMWAPAAIVAPPVVVVPPPPVVIAPPPVVVAPPPPPPPPVCVVALPPWEWLNLRVYPNGPIIGPMPPGTPLALVGPISGRWGFVQTPAGATGWAFLPYTTCR